MNTTKTPKTPTPKSKGAKKPATPKSKGATASKKTPRARKDDRITKVIYSKIQLASDELEKFFFTSKKLEKFPPVVYAINYSCARYVVAYVNPNSLYDTDKKTVCQYLCVNPKFLHRSIGELLSTLCHELCHVYECEYIHVPRGGYHTNEWCKLMRGCGLEPKFLNPSRTAVSHEIIAGGEFEKFVKYFIEKHGENFFNLIAHDYTTTDDGDDKSAPIVNPPADDGKPKADNYGKAPKKYNRNKIKYTCCGCGAKVWGKPNLHIVCADCSAGKKELVFFEPEATETED